MTDFDIADTLAPKSDQLDAVDLAASGPRVFTITKVVVKKENKEQPVSISLAEFPRVWRPNLNTRRVIHGAWPGKSSTYVGRRVRLFYDPDVSYGGIKTGGVRISHMSDLPNGEPYSHPIIVSRGKSAMYTVEPLIEAPKPAPVDISGITDVDTLRSMWRTSNAEVRAQIEARINELNDGALIPSGGAA